MLKTFLSIPNFTEDFSEKLMGKAISQFKKFNRNSKDVEIFC